MDGGFQILDIILFAMIAGFIFLRLRASLGRRSGQEDQSRPRPTLLGEGATEPVSAKDKRSALSERIDRKNDEEAFASASARTAVKQVQDIDTSFDAPLFVAGAKSAYEIIVTAFAKGDLETLKPLLSAEVFAGFSNAIKERDGRGEVHETTLVGFKSAKICDAEIKNRHGEVTVRFQAEIIHAERNAEGNIISGSPHAMDLVTENWTFSRDLQSRDPNWILVATSTPA